MSEVFWSVDSLVVKENAIFGFGWAFHEKHEITALRLRLTFLSKDKVCTEYITADAGKPREDVERAFTHQPRALYSGYVVFGAIPKGAKLDSIHLVCSFKDESVIEFAVPASCVIRFTNENKAENNRLMLKQFYVFFKRGLHLIWSGKFLSLFDKVRRYLKGRSKTGLHQPSALVDIFRADERQNLCVIIDHDLGGGANQYRDRFVDSIIQEGRSIIILTFHVPTLSHVLILKNRRINVRYSIPDKTFLLDAIRYLSVSDVVYNTAVSFIRPEEIPHLLINLKQVTSARLTMLAHDFFLVCPSHFLIDHSGKYCHIPDTSVCSGCLRKNQHGFATLFVERDLPKWRSEWGAALAATDEIITFSHSTSKLLRKAYPQIASSKISVVPHKVDYLTGEIPQVINTSRLRIGVVGHIGFHKGAVFVKALAHEIKRRELDLKIVVIGAIEANCDHSVVSQTGKYQHAELPALIEASGATVMLFPSICPETFSFVVQELIEMNLPVASFNLGAPAERLASYSKGLLLNSMDPASVLDDLISFHHNIYLAN